MRSGGAGDFTPDLPNGFSRRGPAVRLRHVDGLPALGLLRGLRHAPRPSAGIGPCRAATRRTRDASHVHHDPFDRVGSWLYPYSTSGEHSQSLVGHHAQIDKPDVERAAVNQGGIVAVDDPCPPGFGSLLQSRGFWAAGQRIVGLADVLLAVWDGSSSRGLGGTADVVAFAAECGVPTTVVWPPGSRRG